MPSLYSGHKQIQNKMAAQSEDRPPSRHASPTEDRAEIYSNKVYFDTQRQSLLTLYLKKLLFSLFLCN